MVRVTVVRVVVVAMVMVVISLWGLAARDHAVLGVQVVGVAYSQFLTLVASQSYELTDLRRDRAFVASLAQQ